MGRYYMFFVRKFCLACFCPTVVKKVLTASAVPSSARCLPFGFVEQCPGSTIGRNFLPSIGR